MRRILWVGWLLTGLLPAQSLPFSQWPADLKEHFGVTGEILDRAVRYREKGLQIDGINLGWDLAILKAGTDGKTTTAIVTYKPPNRPPFHIQAILCSAGEHATIFDATILGSAEAAADFYQSNVAFVMPVMGGSELMTCFSDSLITGSIVKRQVDDPKIFYFESPDRAIRHLCYWVRFFRAQDVNPKRAAEFLAVALDQEKTLLQEMEVKGDFSLLKTSLNLFDKRLPVENLDPGLPLNESQRASVRTWLQSSIRMRGKLKPFLPEAGPRIAQDEALLVRFR